MHSTWTPLHESAFPMKSGTGSHARTETGNVDQVLGEVGSRNHESNSKKTGSTADLSSYHSR